MHSGTGRLCTLSCGSPFLSRISFLGVAWRFQWLSVSTNIKVRHGMELDDPRLSELTRAWLRRGDATEPQTSKSTTRSLYCTHHFHRQILTAMDRNHQTLYPDPGIPQSPQSQHYGNDIPLSQSKTSRSASPQPSTSYFPQDQHSPSAASRFSQDARLVNGNGNEGTPPKKSLIKKSFKLEKKWQQRLYWLVSREDTLALPATNC